MGHLGQHRRSDHEDNQQNQHHVDVGDHVDFRDDAFFAVTDAPLLTPLVHATMQDCGEPSAKFISHSEAVNFRIEPIVGNHRRNRSKQTDRCGNQGLRNTWRNCCQCDCLTVAKPRNEFIPQTVPNKPMYGLIEPTVKGMEDVPLTVPLLSHGPLASHGARPPSQRRGLILRPDGDA